MSMFLRYSESPIRSGAPGRRLVEQRFVASGVAGANGIAAAGSDPMPGAGGLEEE